MTRLESWLLGISCHAYRNRHSLILLVIVLPLLVAAVVKVLAGSGDYWVEVLR